MSIRERRAVRNVVSLKLKALDTVKSALEVLGSPGGSGSQEGYFASPVGWSTADPEEARIDGGKGDSGATSHRPTPASKQGGARPEIRATPAQVAKFDRHYDALRDIAEAIDKNAESRYKKTRDRTAERWETAQRRLSKRPYHSPRRLVPVVDWADPDARTVLQPAPQQPETADRIEKSWLAGPSKLAKGYTPDDWLWAEAWDEAAEMSGLGYAYRKDRLGRRVHRL